MRVLDQAFDKGVSAGWCDVAIYAAQSSLLISLCARKFAWHIIRHMFCHIYSILPGAPGAHFIPYFGLLGRPLHVWLDPVLDCLALESTHKKMVAYFCDPEYANSWARNGTPGFAKRGTVGLRFAGHRPCVGGSAGRPHIWPRHGWLVRARTPPKI